MDDRFFCADAGLDLSVLDWTAGQRPRVQGGRDSGPARPAGSGRRIGARQRQPGEPVKPLDLCRTLNAALVRRAGESRPHQGLCLAAEDLHLQVRSRPRHRLVVFVIDTSDSMGDDPAARISAALGACISIAATAYLHRDQVCLITFRDREACLVVPPTASVMRVRQQLQRLPVGGATPLAAGLHKARQVIAQARVKNREMQALLVLISDGEANRPLTDGADPAAEALAIAGLMRRERIPALIIDTQASQQRPSLMPRLAQAFGTACRHIHDLRSGQVLQLIDQSGPRYLP